MRKRILSVVVALCLIIGMCPVFASAGGRAFTYVFDSNGVRKKVATPSAAAGTSAGGTTISSEGNGWAWDKATNTLTLSGADFTESSGMMSILLCGNSTIHLKDGTQNILSISKGSNAGAGIYCDSSLTITGKGSLDLKWTGQTYASNEYPELAAFQKLLITDGNITVPSLRGKDKIQVAGGNVTADFIGYCPLDVDKLMESDYQDKRINLSVSGGTLNVLNSSDDMMASYRNSIQCGNFGITGGKANVAGVLQVGKDYLCTGGAPIISGGSLSVSELASESLYITGGVVSVTKRLDLKNDGTISIKNGTLRVKHEKFTIYSSIYVKRIEIDNSNVESNVSFGVTGTSKDDFSLRNVSRDHVKIYQVGNSSILYGGSDPFGSAGVQWKIVAVNAPIEPKPTVGGFNDVHEGDYYAEPVKWAVENKITSGTGDGKFSPGSSCTRGQIVTFLWRAAGEPEPAAAANPFADVSATDYYYKAVMWAVENNITSGTGEGKFSPGASCTRNQAVTFLWRAEGEPGVSAGNTFNDVESGSYYENAVNWAVANKITSGTGANKFSPGQVCTRGQIVTFLYRANG